MSKEIVRFSGLTLNRDEQSVERGELSVCAGVELHDGALRPSVLEGTDVEHPLVIPYPSGSSLVATLLYVHETPSYRHFICESNKDLYWFKEDGTIGNRTTMILPTPTHEFAPSDVIQSVTSVGNTLLVLAKSGLHYIHWKDDDYKYLGTQYPFVDIQFRPDGGHKAEYEYLDTMPYADYEGEKDVAFRVYSPNSGDIYAIDGSDTDGYKDRVRIKNDYQSAITEQVQALVNQTHSKVASDGHFYAPFFIRYCYRLYDGSMVMHSAPLFMNVTMPHTSHVYACNLVTWTTDQQTQAWHGEKGTFELFGDFDVQDRYGGAFQSRSTLLCYKPSNVGIEYRIPSLPADLADWSDIIASVDIFVSRQYPREDFSEKITRCVKAESLSTLLGVRESTLSRLKLAGDSTDRTNDDIWYVLRDTPPGPIIQNVEPIAPYDINVVYDIKRTGDTEYLEMLRNTSNFYKIKSIDVKDLSATGNTFNALEYEKYVIPNITTQEEMIDEYRTHHLLLPDGDKNYGCYVYNHRLNLYGIKEHLFEGFMLYQMTNISDSAPDGYSDITITRIVVELKTDAGSKYVQKAMTLTTSQYLLCHSVLFYPDSRAFRMYLFTDDSHVVVMKMKQHAFLNGAISTDYFYKDTVTQESASFHVFPFNNADHDSVPLASKLITSEVDNPYYFPVGGRNTVGVGHIIGIAAVTRALSQGQVGDHDLAVFSTDGIWVLKVSATGTYNSAHNISREVCSNAKSICQLDQSIVFATERSLSRFVESDVVSMSDVLDGPVRDWSVLFGNDFDDVESISRQLDFGMPAVEMFNKGSVLYDYAGARVVVLPEHAANTQGTVALVFSIRDKAWSTMAIPAIRATVPGYPSPFVQQDDGRVIVLDKTYGYRTTGATIAGLVLTRTLTFSDAMDVIRGFRQYSDSEVRPMLYFFGSNDQRIWQQIGKTDRWYYNYIPGHPFRFFKVAVYMQMKPSEEYQQLMLEVVGKYAKL